MATTYTLISSQTLTGTTASVTFSSIPQTYTDLVLRSAILFDTGSNMTITLNGNSSTVYSRTGLRGDGSAGVSSRVANSANWLQSNSGNLTTANTFASHELYIPNYTSSAIKPINNYYVNEANNSTAYMWTFALLFNNTSAVSSITLTGDSVNFVSGCTFYLYGIKNS